MRRAGSYHGARYYAPWLGRWVRQAPAVDPAAAVAARGARGHAHPQRRRSAQGGGLVSRVPSARRTTRSAPPGWSAAARSAVPGEASLAHHGVLFLDELGEFPRPTPGGAPPAAGGRPGGDRPRPARDDLPDAVHARRRDEPVPVRARRASAAGARRQTSPAIAAGSAARCWTASTCSSTSSGPTAEPARARPELLGARARARRRRPRAAGGPAARAPAATQRPARRPPAARARRPGAGADGLLARVYERGQLGARGHDRVLRVARTVADLDGSGRSHRARRHGARLRQDAEGRRRHDAPRPNARRAPSGGRA